MTTTTTTSGGGPEPHGIIDCPRARRSETPDPRCWARWPHLRYSDCGDPRRSSLGQPELIESGRPSTSHGVQPLRRQPAQLMPGTFVSGDPVTVSNTESSGGDGDGGTEEDQDSEMGEA